MKSQLQELSILDCLWMFRVNTMLFCNDYLSQASLVCKGLQCLWFLINVVDYFTHCQYFEHGRQKKAKVNDCNARNIQWLLLCSAKKREKIMKFEQWLFCDLWFPFICIWIHLYDANIPRVTSLACYVEIWFHVMLHIHASVWSRWVITLGKTILAVIWFRNANSKQTCSEYRNQMEYMQLFWQNLFMIFTQKRCQAVTQS